MEPRASIVQDQEVKYLFQGDSNSITPILFAVHLHGIPQNEVLFFNAIFISFCQKYNFYHYYEIFGRKGDEWTCSSYNLEPLTLD